MAIGDKILTNRFIELKNAVKQECQRRCYTGSVSSYGNTDYDYSIEPAVGNQIKKEHYDKNAIPLNAINQTTVQKSAITTEESIKDSDYVILENAVSSFASKSRYSTTQSGTGCSASCTGLCYTTCSGSCTSTCVDSCGVNGCTSCTSCSGSCYIACAQDCTTGCTSCTSCTGKCQGTCTAFCAPGGCMSSCTSCTGCTGCTGCSGTCSTTCTGKCSGCTSCTDTCASWCTTPGCAAGCTGPTACSTACSTAVKA